MDLQAVDRLIARAKHDGDFVESYYDKLRVLLSEQDELEPLARLVALELLSFLELSERKQRRLARQLVGGRRSHSLATRRAEALADLNARLEQTASARPQWAALVTWAQAGLPDWSLSKRHPGDDLIAITGVLLDPSAQAVADELLAAPLYAAALDLCQQATGTRPAPLLACVPQALGFFAGNHSGCYFDGLDLILLCAEPTLGLLLHELIHATQPATPEGRTLLDHWLMEGATEGLTRLYLPAGESSRSYPELVDFVTALARLLTRELGGWLCELSQTANRDGLLARLLGLPALEQAPDELVLAIHHAYYHNDLHALACGDEARVTRLVTLLRESLGEAGLFAGV